MDARWDAKVSLSPHVRTTCLSTYRGTPTQQDGMTGATADIAHDEIRHLVDIVESLDKLSDTAAQMRDMTQGAIDRIQELVKPPGGVQ